jgi:MFS family permease
MIEPCGVKAISHQRLLGLLSAPYISMVAIYQAVQQILLPNQMELINRTNEVANLSLVIMLASLTAIAGIVVGGALSDRTRGRWGRRSPWLVVMAFVAGSFLALLASARSVRAIAVGAAGLWFSLNFYEATINAVLPDRIPENRRGGAASVIGLGVPLGVLLGVNLAGHLPSQAVYMCLGMGLILATGFFVAFAQEEAFYGDPARVAASPATHCRGEVGTWLCNFSRLLQGFSTADFTYAFSSRFLVFLAFVLITSYQFYLLQDYIDIHHRPDYDAGIAVSILGTYQTIAWFAAVAVAGWLADRLGRCKLFAAISAIGMAVALLVPVLWPTWQGMIIFDVLCGAFFGTYWAVGLALMSLVLPSKESAGQDLGVLGVATAAPTLVSPALAPLLINACGYLGLFLCASVLSLLGGMTVLLIKRVR